MNTQPQTERTPMPLSWAGLEGESEVVPGPMPRLLPQDVTAPSAEDLLKIKKLIQERRSLPKGSRKQQMAIATKIWWLRHPGYTPDKSRATARKRKWVENNRERKKKQALAWYYRNRPPTKTLTLSSSRVAVYYRQRRIKSIQFALADRVRSSLNRAFRRKWVKKPAKTEELVGCSIQELKTHIESQFVNGMSWDNRKSFHVDHIVPIVAFDMRSLEEVRCAFNWKNLRPLSGRDNQSKQATIPNPLPSWIPTHIAERISERSKT